jgi:hypothetical protein
MAELVSALVALRRADREAVWAGVEAVQVLANGLGGSSGDGSAGSGQGGGQGGEGRGIERALYKLARDGGTETNIWFELLVGLLLSERGGNTLEHLNPLMTSSSASSTSSSSSSTADAVLQGVTAIMLRGNRVGHTSRCVRAAQKVLGSIRSLKEAMEQGEVRFIKGLYC